MMDCNKEEAYRAREIAEKKMQNRDFNGARKIAQKAQHLFPELENILQMLTVCEVHCAADIKVNGEVDWYGVLQLGSTADDSSIKKQYRKLALLLHPDKNQFAGAEAAFKIIGEAHMILSDRARRHLYDTRRNAITKPVHSKQFAQQSDKSTMGKKNFNALHTKGFHPHHQQSPPPSSFDTSLTFWTICPGCGIRYQLFCSILKKFIRCQNCLIPFVAFQSNAKDGFGIHQQVPVQTTNNAKPKSQTGNPSSSMAFKEVVAGESTVHFEHDGLTKKVTTDGGVGSGNEVKLEKTKLSEFHKPEKDPKPPKRNVDMNRGRKESVKPRYSDKTNNEDDPIAKISSSPVSRRSARHMQSIHFNEDRSEDDDDFVNHPRHKKLKSDTFSEGHKPAYFCSDSNNLLGPDSTNSTDVSRENMQEEYARAKEKVPYVSKGVDKDTISGNKEDTMVEKKPGTSSKSQLDSFSNTTPEQCTFTYPDTEFFDFEKLKDVNEFAADQIWAVYDNLDGMPRFYAQIRRINTKNFKLWFTWLEHTPSNESETAWSDADLPVGCGNYELGSSHYAEDRLMFSHIISWEKKNRKNSYSIYPRKGEVWALFKDWNIGWSLVADNRLFEYEVVLVLSDFDGSGICVVPLLKIEGFISLFVQSKDKSFVIPIDETLKFSHKIPSYRLTGKEKEGIPQGCLELDPASLPFNFSNTFPSVSLTERIEKLDQISNSCLNCISPEEPRINMVHDVECKLNVKQIQAAEKLGKQNQTSENHHSDAQTNTKSDKQPAKEAIKQKDGLDDRDLNYGSKENFKLPKFHEAKFPNFGEGKSIENLQRGQIWALRGDTDKYPKNYAWVKKIFAGGVLHMGCLEACPVFDEEIRWVEEGMPISCGKFKVEQLSIITVKLDMLSHPVQAKPVERRKRYLIFPSCGEIWAVYKNWNVGWRLADLLTCEYDVVEICECTDAGFRVRPLKSVQGYRAILKPEIEGKTLEIPIHECTRFSHKIPSFPLTMETGGALQDCWQLDTASLPK